METIQKETTVEKGRRFEKEAELILLEEGYNIVEHTSLNNYISHYDFEVEKGGINYYVEVRGRKGDYFPFSKRKINLLRALPKKVLLLLINEKGHSFIELDKIKEVSVPLRFGNKRVYVVSIKGKSVLISVYIPDKDIIKYFDNREVINKEVRELVKKRLVI